MKKLLILSLCIVCLTAVFMVCAKAAPARDITADCTFRFSDAAGHVAHLHDGDYETYMESPKKEKHRLYITTGSEPAAGVYVEFGIRRLPFTVEAKRDGKWVQIASSAGLYAQEYVSFPPCSGELRLTIGSTERQRAIRICEITVLGEGEIDYDRIHIWQQPVEKADLLLSVTHPDDDLLWFGGMIPYYTAEKKLSVLVSYLSVSDSYRELELLNALWYCGVRNYPEIAYLKDFKTYDKKEVYEKWGRESVHTYLVKIIRKYKPEVVVTQDYAGEYGHGQHLACAESTHKAVEYAQDAARYRESAGQYGTWEVKKLYVHLGDNPTVMDWHQPLDAFNGKTSFEIASEAYQLHESQLRGGMIYEMADRGTKYDSFAFTLVLSRVGEDTAGGDLFENVPAECISTYNK